MARFGPTGYAFELDGWNAGTNAVTAAQELDGITETSGIKIKSETVESTAFGHGVKNQIPTGVIEITNPTLKGFLDDVATGAFKRIGRAVRRADAAARTLKITHKTGIEQSVEVICVRNDLLPQVGSSTMFEAEFTLVSGDAADFVEAGV